MNALTFVNGALACDIFSIKSWDRTHNKLNRFEVGKMPGDPKERRERAAGCAKFAVDAEIEPAWENSALFSQLVQTPNVSNQRNDVRKGDAAEMYVIAKFLS